MTELKIYCDHCGKDLPTMNGYNDCDIDLPDIKLNTDLCADCVNKLSKLVCEFLNKEKTW